MFSIVDSLVILHGNSGWWDEGAYVIAAVAGALAVATFAFSVRQSRREEAKASADPSVD
jgi:hypothetical protein